MKLFTKEVDKQLFAQYPKGSDLDNQMVVAKIFNPYGRGVWYLLNSDPNDPDYIWAIVDLFEPDMGSVSRSELQTVKVPPFGLGLERDIYFTPKPAKEVFEGIMRGERFAHGGMTAGRYYKDNSGNEFRYIGESEGKLLFKDGEKIITKSHEDFEDAPKEKKLFGIFADGGAVKGRNNQTGESYGVVIGSVQKADDEYTDAIKMNVRTSYESRICESSVLFDKNGNLLSTTDYGCAYDGKYPSLGVGSGRNYYADKKETLQVLSKKYNPAFAKKLIELAKDNKMPDGGETAAAENNIKQAKYGARLVGKQKNLDVNKNGKLDAEDFKMLRGKMAMGGKVKFEDKVKAVKESLLKRKKVSPKVQKDYGKTYDRKEALEAAKRIVGAQTAKYELKKKFKEGGKTIAQTPAPKKDRVFGSSKNKAGSASSKKTASNIELNESIVKTLGEKAKKYNENHSSKVSTSTLKAVMRRGMGAYSTSHRPTITGGAPNSRQAWGFARVNKFLLKKGGTKVKAAYVQDDDLMENGGELKKEMRVSDKPKFKKLMEIEDKARDSMYKPSNINNFSKWNETVGVRFRDKWNKMVLELRGYNDTEGNEKDIKQDWIEYCKEQGLVKDYNFGDVLA